MERKSLRDNDCDDSDPGAHPRNSEANNEVDDDCDGEVDEPDILYHTVIPNGAQSAPIFHTIRMQINDQDMIDYINGGGTVYYSAHIVPLDGSHAHIQHPATGRTSAGLAFDPSTDVLHIVGAHLSSHNLLHPRTVYVVYLDLLNDLNQLLAEVTWLTTSGGSTVDPSTPFDNKRVDLALRAISEAIASDRGEVGYMGSVDLNGTRYILSYLYGNIDYATAVANTNWCVGFVKWMYDMHDGLYGVGFDTLEDYALSHYFKDPPEDDPATTSFWHNDGKSPSDDPLNGVYPDYHGAPLVPDADALSNPASGQIGDYVVHGNIGGTNHVAMFLAYNPNTETLWTIDGNVSNEVRLTDHYMPPYVEDPAINPTSREYWTAIGRVEDFMFGL